MKIKFNIMKGVEEGFADFPKLIEPALIVSMITWLISLGQKFFIGTPELDRLNPLKSLSISSVRILIVLVSASIGYIFLYYYKDFKSDDESSLSEKIGGGFLVSFKTFFGLFVLMLSVIFTFGILFVLIARLTGDIGLLPLILIIPIVIIMPFFMLTPHAMIFDDLGLLAGVKKSFSLVSHNYFRLVFFIICIGLPGLLLTFLGEKHVIIYVIVSFIQQIIARIIACIYGAVYLQTRLIED